MNEHQHLGLYVSAAGRARLVLPMSDCINWIFVNLGHTRTASDGGVGNRSVLFDFVLKNRWSFVRLDGERPERPLRKGTVDANHLSALSQHILLLHILTPTNGCQAKRNKHNRNVRSYNT